MTSQLTIVIPTRDRLPLLELCLQSVFERQERVPKVIVSDNSTTDLPGMTILRRKFPFVYIRQSGKLSMFEHETVCIRLASTPWAMLLHDDDELYPEALEKIQPLLASTSDIGVGVGGIQYIDQDGIVRGVWVPDLEGTFKGEDIVLRLGLDYQACPPGILWNVAALGEIGGFPNSNGTANEQVAVLHLAYRRGVTFLPYIVGRYRIWSDQFTSYASPNQAEVILDCTIEGARSIRAIGLSTSAADQLMDYMIWWVFRFVVPLFSKHPLFVSRLCRKCEIAAPPDGLWRNRVRQEHPYLFWKPRRLSVVFFLAFMTLCPRPLRQYIKQALPRRFYKPIG